MVGVLAQHEIHKLAQCARRVGVKLQLLIAKLSVPQKIIQSNKTVVPVHREMGCAPHCAEGELELVYTLHLAAVV